MTPFTSRHLSTKSRQFVLIRFHSTYNSSFTRVRCRKLLHPAIQTSHGLASNILDNRIRQNSEPVSHIPHMYILTRRSDIVIVFLYYRSSKAEARIGTKLLQEHSGDSDGSFPFVWITDANSYTSVSSISLS